MDYIVFSFILALSSGICFSLGPEENLRMFEGDMIMSPRQLIEFKAKGVNPKIPLGSTTFRRWPRSIPYEIDSTLASEPRAKSAIYAAISDYEKLTCLRFHRRRTTERDYMAFFKGKGCSSYVGIQSGRQEVSLAAGCWSKGVVMHEIAHALGFLHEQSRPDRDSYVTILFGNIDKDAAGNFEKQSTRYVDSLGFPYDYDSVMHYGERYFTTNGQLTIKTKYSRDQRRIGQRNGFSAIDVKQMNALYQCNKKPMTNRPRTRWPPATRRPVTRRPWTQRPRTRRPVTRRPITSRPVYTYTVYTCNGGSMYLYCTGNKKIRLVDVFYGYRTAIYDRGYRNRCNRRTFPSSTPAHCYSRTSYSKAWAKCQRDRKSHCRLYATQLQLGTVQSVYSNRSCSPYVFYSVVKYQCV